eukprot:828022-Pelagomonas_calceolata.AAC.4
MTHIALLDCYCVSTIKFREPNPLSPRFSGISICHPIYDDKAMTSPLRQAIYSAILNTEATATFMFLPASNKLMTANPYSKLLISYPHFCCKLGNNVPSTHLGPSNYCSMEYGCKSPPEQPKPWLQGVTPKAWKKSDIILIYKEKGSQTDIAFYRPIGLANTIYKLWTRL